MKYQRVLLKLSGELLAGSAGYGIHPDGLAAIVAELKTLPPAIQTAIVIGGGNLWRGAAKDMDRVTADHIGMLATVMNALALKDALVRAGLKAHVQSAFGVDKLAEPYARDRAAAYMERGGIVILAGGTGNPYFTTDTTAALRAAELRADAVLKATQVDGVYDDDPKKNPRARRYERLSFDEAIAKNLRVMDTAAFSLCRESKMPVIVFDFHKPGNLAKVLAGENVGTLVTCE